MCNLQDTMCIVQYIIHIVCYPLTICISTMFNGSQPFWNEPTNYPYFAFWSASTNLLSRLKWTIDLIHWSDPFGFCATSATIALLCITERGQGVLQYFCICICFCICIIFSSAPTEAALHWRFIRPLESSRGHISSQIAHSHLLLDLYFSFHFLYLYSLSVFIFESIPTCEHVFQSIKSHSNKSSKEANGLSERHQCHDLTSLEVVRHPWQCWRWC